MVQDGAGIVWDAANLVRLRLLKVPDLASHLQAASLDLTTIATSSL